MAFLLAPLAPGAVLVWDRNGGTAGTGGTGTWITGTPTRWRLNTATGTLQAWTNGTPNGDTAAFQSGAGTVTIGSGVTINVNGLTFSTTGYVIAGAAGATLNLDGTTPTINTGAVDATISAVISGAGLTKVGSGTLTLLNQNTYTGPTNISEGTLLLTGADRISSASALEMNGGNLSTDNTQTLQSLTLSASSTLDLNNAGAVTFDGGGSWSGAFVYFGDFETLAVSNYSNAASAYALRFFGDWTGDGGFNTFASNTTINGSAAGISFDGTYTNVGFAMAAVPEPSTVLAGLAMIAFIGYRERKPLAAAFRRGMRSETPR